MAQVMSKGHDKRHNNLSVRKLHDSLGAEVRGVDFSKPISAEIVASLKKLWSEHLVLVIPEQAISDQQHVDITRCFGEPEVFHQDILKSAKIREIFRVSNTDEDDNIMPPAHPTMKQLHGARLWHTDSSYREKPAVGSLLHGIEVSRTGGLTCFTNMYDVWAALPEQLKSKVAGRKAKHDFAYLSVVTGGREQTEAERAAMPAVWQPLVRRHPVTGRTSLYISPIYNTAIESMDDDEAIALVGELAEFASQDRFVYRHQWETDDIVMWDNRCTMHYVTPHDALERRVMHRTTIEGEEIVVAA